MSFLDYADIGRVSDNFSGALRSKKLIDLIAGNNINILDSSDIILVRDDVPGAEMALRYMENKDPVMEILLNPPMSQYSVQVKSARGIEGYTLVGLGNDPVYMKYLHQTSRNGDMLEFVVGELEWLRDWARMLN